MSESAGRVLQIHKGTYSDSAVYNQLDEVLYNGSTYVAKQSTIGNIPTNTTYWQLVAQKGADGTSGQGVPAGGTTGQVLTKHSNDDYDAEWSDPDAGIPDGGATGQFLMKKSATDYDTEWGDALSIEEARENELIPGKNLAVFNPFVGTESSVSTVVSDASTGELTLNGSASGSAIICISDPVANPSGSKDGSLNLKAGTYVLSSPQYSALSASFYLAVVDKNGNKKASFQPQSASDDHVEFTLNSDTNGLFIAIYLSSGAYLSSQKLQVMICTLADWNASHTYEPYYVPVKNRTIPIISNASADFQTWIRAQSNDYESVEVQNSPLVIIGKLVVFQSRIKMPANATTVNIIGATKPDFLPAPATNMPAVYAQVTAPIAGEQALLTPLSKIWVYIKSSTNNTLHDILMVYATD